MFSVISVYFSDHGGVKVIKKHLRRSVLMA